MYFYAKNPSKIFGGGFDLDLAEQFLIPTMFTAELHRIVNLTEYRIPNIFVHEEFPNTEYRIVFVHEKFSNTEYRIVFVHETFPNTEYRIVFVHKKISNTEYQIVFVHEILRIWNTE